MSSSIILIGLPGSGKSTLGVQLAKHIGFNFIDTDIVIQSKTGETLQKIMDEQGYLALRKIEEAVLTALESVNEVIATGGSAVYSEAAMHHLRQLGTVVYLRVSTTEILKRIDNESTRGIARSPQQTLKDVIEERLPLYEKHADYTFDNEGPTNIAALAELIAP